MADQVVDWQIIEQLFPNKSELIRFKGFMKGKNQPRGNKVYMKDVYSFLRGDR